MEKRSKDKMGPLGGKSLVVFIDDFNMPKKISLESPFQPALELASLTGIAMTIMSGVVAMQRHTVDAEMLVADDYIYALYPKMANVYQICQLFSWFIVLAFVVGSAGFAARNRKVVAAAFVIDFFVFQAIHIILFDWVIGSIIIQGASAKSHPLVWGSQMIYRTHAQNDDVTRNNDDDDDAYAYAYA